MNKIEFIAAFLLFAYCTTSSHHFVSSAMSSPPPSANTNPNTNNAAAAKGVIDFLTQARGLKTTKRTGWVRQEAGPQIESVADHSWRISLMAMVAATTSAESSITLDTNKCIQMALVHDLAEATVGDITPHCGVSDEEKHKLEKEAMENLCRLLPISNHNIQELWKEYEDGVSEEAKLVKDLDKLEMILQALEYEKDGKNGKSLDGFFDSTRGKWRTSIGQAWGEEIEARRAKGTTATIDETKPASSVEPAEKKQKLEK